MNLISCLIALYANCEHERGIKVGKRETKKKNTSWLAHKEYEYQSVMRMNGIGEKPRTHLIR